MRLFIIFASVFICDNINPDYQEWLGDHQFILVGLMFIGLLWDILDTVLKTK